MSTRLLAVEVAEQLRVEKATINRWAAAGRIRAYKVGKLWLFEQKDVDEFVKSGPNSVAVEPTRRRRRRAA